MHSPRSSSARRKELSFRARLGHDERVIEGRPSRALMIIAAVAAIGVVVFMQVRGKSMGLTFVAAGTVLVIAYAIHSFSAGGE